MTQIAEVAHAALHSYRHVTGGAALRTWENANNEHQKATIYVVEQLFDNPAADVHAAPIFETVAETSLFKAVVAALAPADQAKPAA
jgi:maltooligosyltrehalose synthase